MARPSNTDQRRTQIVSALREVMAERGYERASISEVAQRAGLTSGLVHYHFKDKQEILLALIDVLWRDAQGRIEQRSRGRDGLEPVIDALLAMGPDADLAAVRCWVAISAEAIRQPEVGIRFGGVIQELLALLETRASALLREHTGSAQGARQLAAAVLASIQGFFVLAASAPEAIPAGSAAGSVKQLVRGFLAARANR